MGSGGTCKHTADNTDAEVLRKTFHAEWASGAAFTVCGCCGTLTSSSSAVQGLCFDPKHLGQAFGAKLEPSGA